MTLLVESWRACELKVDEPRDASARAAIGQQTSEVTWLIYDEPFRVKQR
jgi:hypothetical protein